MSKPAEAPLQPITVPKSKIFFEKYLFPVALVVLLLLPHILFFQNGYVDLEDTQSDAAAQLISRGFNAQLEDYFTKMANPLLSVFLFAGSYSIFGESVLVSRLTIFAVALIFILLLYYYLKKKEGFFTASITSVLVAVNPLVIVYSQYVSGDLLYLAILSFALLLFFYARSYKGLVVSSVALGLSLATKFVTVITFPVVFVYTLLEDKILNRFSPAKFWAFIRFNFWYFALAVLVSLPVVLLVFLYQDSLLSSEFQSRHSFSVDMLVSRFFAYILWLGLFLGPACLIFIYDFVKRTGIIKFSILLVALAAFDFILTRFVPISSLHALEKSFGEMNLGGLENYIPEPQISVALFFVLLIAEMFIAGMILEFKNRRNSRFIFLFFWILMPVVFMSFTRAANRYMFTLLVPLSLYTTDVARRLFTGRTRIFVFGVLAFHVLLCLTAGFLANHQLGLRGLNG